MSHENILVETRSCVDLITLNRPRAFNALSDTLTDKLGAAPLTFDADANTGVIVITGSEKTLTAGTDIGAMADYDFATVYKNEYIMCNWEIICRIRKSMIATVAGYAPDGGCELTTTYDVILAADTAKFGQPEIKLGTMPDVDDTRRLPRAVSRAKAVGLYLTAHMMGVEEAKRAGLVSCVTPADKLLDEAIQAVGTIAGFSLPMTTTIKKLTSAVYETSSSEDAHLERRLFHSTFTTKDQKEGTRAFIEKRAPTLKHQ